MRGSITQPFYGSGMFPGLPLIYFKEDGNDSKD